MPSTSNYTPKNKVRFVTAASLFDGHDASISIIRRLLQRGGAEVIHLGHNRSVAEIVDSVIEEDVQAVAVSSYQGGHNEFFRYLVDLLRERGAPYVKVFGGGGGVIVSSEIRALEEYGVTKIYSPEDGRRFGLKGIINDMLEAADFPLKPPSLDGGIARLGSNSVSVLARLITLAELNGRRGRASRSHWPKSCERKPPSAPSPWWGSPEPAEQARAPLPMSSFVGWRWISPSCGSGFCRSIPRSGNPAERSWVIASA